VGIRLSPITRANGCAPDSNPNATYGALVDALAQRRIAFLHFIEGNTGAEISREGFDFDGARKRFPGTYIANNKYTRHMALDAVASGQADAVAFGVPFISNPDLVRRLQLDAPLTPANIKTYYGPGPVGYTDYPTLEQQGSVAPTPTL
jgi:N-ethylmaleimide reductase